MFSDDVDELLAFQRVRVVRSTTPALLCAIGDKRVWLPREHIRGRLWSRGDRGTLFVRRWVALDRRLTLPGESIVPHQAAAQPNVPAHVMPKLPDVERGH
jgi:hypothetical protein